MHEMKSVWILFGTYFIESGLKVNTNAMYFGALESFMYQMAEL